MTGLLSVIKPTPAPPPEIEKLQKTNPAVDWALRLRHPTRRLLAWLERLTLVVEKPIGRLIHDQRLNPLYHTGTLTVLALVVLLATGVYLTMFYQYGFVASYTAVARMETHFFNRLIRALHRYASDSAVVLMLLHGWRTFIQDRFRGPRWLAWITGIGLAVLVWLIGVTGYWLIWDERAHVLNQTLFNWLQNSALGAAFLVRFVVSEDAGTGWQFLLILFLLHFGLSLAVIAFLVWHLKRLSRPKWLPPQHLSLIGVAALLVAALIFPAGMLPAINPTLRPQNIPLDIFYLFYLPGALNLPAGVFWGGVLLLIVIVATAPWWMRRKTLPPVTVDLNLCDGCTLCERDCPYQAIRMIERTDDARAKYEAAINPALCVACGVCVGSCPENALTLSMTPVNKLFEVTRAAVQARNGQAMKVVFACERHMLNGARQVADGDATMQIIPLTCISMAHPSLAEQALRAGAAEVQFVGCPAEDCANREGNVWLQQRLNRERLPKLNPEFANAPIRTRWLAPNEFASAATPTTAPNTATAYGLAFKSFAGRSGIGLAIVLIVFLAVQLGLSQWPFQPYAANEAVVAFTLKHRSGYPVAGAENPLPLELGLDMPVRLALEVNGQPLLDKEYAPQGSGLERASVAFEQFRLPAGEHALRLLMYDRPAQNEPQVLYNERLTLQAGQTLTLPYQDASIGGDPLAGEQLYYEMSLGTNAACRICHSLTPDEVLVGPSLAGVSTRAETRVPGLSAEAYLRQSILDPNAYVVPGFPAGQMVTNLGQVLTPEQVDDLVAFLLTLK